MNSERSFLTGQEVFNELTLSQIVAKDYRAATIFEKHNLDFCCNGNKALGAACSEKGLDAKEILFEIQNADNVAADFSLRFNNWELDFLVDYIINNHHRYVRDSIPVISSYTAKVAAVHGANHPETIEVAKIFSKVYKELKQHLMKEEEILFPYIKHLANVKKNISKFEPPYFGSIANPIKMMEAEHVSAGDGLFEIRNLTENYSLPQDACNTFTACYKKLKEFEEDLHKHVYLENSILFPKSIQLEENILHKNLAAGK